MVRFLILALAVWLLWHYLRRSLPLTPRREERSGWDPWAVLELRRGASAEEITRAYREQIKLYHPDRVADLGEDLQRVAHERTLLIQRAYDELSGGRGSGAGGR